jgi:hypothetical protein
MSTSPLWAPPPSAPSSKNEEGKGPPFYPPLHHKYKVGSVHTHASKSVFKSSPVRFHCERGGGGSRTCTAAHTLEGRKEETVREMAKPTKVPMVRVMASSALALGLLPGVLTRVGRMA